MRSIFKCESIASPETQKKCLIKITDLAMSLPKGYFYSIKVNGSQDKKIKIDVGGTYFDLYFYVWDSKGKNVLWRNFEDSDGTLEWNRIYYATKRDISNLSKNN